MTGLKGMASSCAGSVWVGHKETLLIRKSSQALGRVAQGGGGVGLIVQTPVP